MEEKIFSKGYLLQICEFFHKFELIGDAFAKVEINFHILPSYVKEVFRPVDVQIGSYIWQEIV